MLIQYSYGRNYLFTALAAAPTIFEYLLHGITPAQADKRPDPARFSIREVLAHLADWDEIFLARLIRTRDEAEPTIPGYDEGQRALDLDYASTDLAAQQQLFQERRARLVAFLHSLPADQWQRACLRPEIGRITIEDMAVLIALHDTYHVQQVTAWLQHK